LSRSTRALACAVAFTLALPAFAQEEGLGLVREPDLEYKSFQRAPRFRAFLPPAVDLSPRFPVAGSQGRQGSCVAWAVGYSLRSYYEGKRRNWSYYDADRLISPAFIYNRLHNYNGNCNQGTSISAALEFMKNEGAPTLAAFPYVESDCTRAPDPAVQAKAGEFRIRSWQSIEPQPGGVRHADLGVVPPREGGRGVRRHRVAAHRRPRDGDRRLQRGEAGVQAAQLLGHALGRGRPGLGLLPRRGRSLRPPVRDGRARRRGAAAAGRGPQA
jgi:hypothetical protein